jgi:hypothetical protein
MTEAEFSTPSSPSASHAAWLTDAWRTAGPPLLFGLRLCASVSPALYIAFWLECRAAAFRDRYVPVAAMVPMEYHGVCF